MIQEVHQVRRHQLEPRSQQPRRLSIRAKIKDADFRMSVLEKYGISFVDTEEALDTGDERSEHSKSSMEWCHIIGRCL